ncbi:unnamed protein product [Penicillium olsonii]|uniref:alpha-amylase n=1 Tax=Penicillium olsonii TaxID=99116 RepID=A0A9W4IHU7_PENOL|nr:unnamed protein product [Penicillium olsonii]CAG8300811.1 unnamed protein product [Penicillium olsonii]
MMSWALRRLAGLCALTGLVVSTSAAGLADWKARSIYQTMTDRFARTDGSTTASCNTTAGLYCGGTWRGTIDKLDYIQGMGFDAVMISPIVENVEGTVEYGEAYHGYWSWNLNKLNAHFGTHQDLLDLGAALRSRGMYLMLDTVINNMAYITNGSSPATHIKYADLTPFNNADYFHNYCKITDWNNMTNAQICQTGDNIVALPDLYTEHEDVQNMMIKWAKDAIKTYSIDGLRIDAAKHVSPGFLTSFYDGIGETFMTGEVLVGEIDTIVDYQKKYIKSMPNYPIYFEIIHAFTEGNTALLAKAVENMRISIPDVNALASFSENHDKPRIAGLSKDISIAKNVLVFTMLFDGIPMVYQGQEQHLDGNATPDNREAIWLTKYPTDTVLYKLITKLNLIRKHAYILSRDYLELPTHTIYQDSSVLAFTKGVEGRQVIMVLSSQPSTSTYYTISLPLTYNAGTQVLDVLNCKNYTVDNAGMLQVGMDKGEPRVFFPTEYMDGSGLCGFPVSNASLATIKTGKDITSYSSGAATLGSSGLAASIEQQASWTAPDNSLIFQTFEWHVPADRSHWRRLRDALPGYKAMGIDQIWIPPGCKGMDAHGNGYDIYDLYDLGEFDQKGAVPTKWGTKQELEDLMLQAEILEIRVIWDAVLNHKAGADYPEPFKAVKVDSQSEISPRCAPLPQGLHSAYNLLTATGRDVEISEPVEVNGWTGFEFSGRGDQYSSMKYHWQHFSGIDWDDKSKQNAIYKIVAPNKGWAQDVSTEKGNYDYLMFADLDLTHPEVRADLLQWGTWITKGLSLNGMRLDAAKHFSTEFQKAFVQHVRQTANPDFFAIGEYWTGHLPSLLGYLEKVEYQLNAYDVPLVESFSRASHAKGSDLRGILRNTLVDCRPDHAVVSYVRKIRKQPLTFSDHCVEPRYGQMLETPVAPSFKLLAYALILLRKGGHPCVFYGDLYGIRANVENPMTPSCNGLLPILMQARKLYANGEQQDYFDQPNCIGFVRYGNARHLAGLACVISNSGSAVQRMYVGQRHAYEEWVDVLHPEMKPVVIDKKGYGGFAVNAMSASVWVESAAVSRDALVRDL